MKLTDPIYTDENKAREHLESLHWPHGPNCPHCGNANPDRITKLQGKSTRPGVYKCKECRKPFSVTVGTLMERSHIKINVWLAAMHLLTASKKGMSAHQMHRMLGITYESAWFLCHRLREAMRDDPKSSGPLGGKNKVVEVDEAYVGGKAKNRAHRKPAPKKPVLSLVERDGRVASFHIANVTAETVRPIIVTTADRASAFMTDESTVYPKIGKEYASHGTVNHSANEYVRLGSFMHINTAENFFSILKRGINGVYHQVSEAHLHRYLAEFDFRYNNRVGLGVTDTERCERAIKGMVGKRLTYRRVDEASHA
ncbi:IS1595 family transposase [Mesorhizobium sp. AR02]|uniref:IS1595 family transposase n=1 Tax=Mesorhizobium sp. AR02 TaxID=2865837 RepID=UPI00215FC6E0|nr:IS1595 family transposase [Mesorhizobium sp. AR02]UVK53336.1 IS1595 family transposase [Mesorhizobium sp. AR02]